MKNPEQYKKDSSQGTVPVTPKKLILTKTSTDIKIEQLEEQIMLQHKDLLKMRRDIGRLKSDLSDIIGMIRSRG